jgi:hypothetical protein
MKTLLELGAASLLTVAGLLLAASVMADEDASHRLGDHPAVVVQRLQKTAGYDYTSKFYAHPAGLYLYGEAPRDAVQPAASALAEAKAQPAERAVARQTMASPKPAARIGG